MNSLFLRLYVLIVVSVVGIGILLNTVWQWRVDERLKQSEHELLASTMVLQLQHIPADTIPDVVAQMRQTLGLELSLLPAGELPESLFEAGRAVSSVFLEDGDRTAVYTKIPQDPRILRLGVLEDPRTELYQLFLLLAFYGLIAIAVFYWIWPLSKDLNRLENALADFDHSQWGATVRLPPGSSIAHLAKAYNRLLEKIKRLIENEKAMASAISHELRTPLARIRFALQMAQETDNATHIAQQLGSIEEDVSEMNQLISELLSFASLDDTTYTAKLEKGDIGTLINTLINRLSKNFPDHRIDFETDELTGDVWCDSYLMERAVQNLVINACKYGKCAVQVCFFCTERDYCIRVEDDGDGVQHDMRDKIFDSFFRMPGTEKSKGFGLGLAIVNRVMELHQGSIRVETSTLGGALFELSWPKHD